MSEKQKAKTPRLNFVLRAEENSNVDSTPLAQRFTIKHNDRFTDPSINYVENVRNNRIFNEYRTPEKEVGIELRLSEVEPLIYDVLQDAAIADLSRDRGRKNQPYILYNYKDSTLRYLLSSNPWIYLAQNLRQDYRNAKLAPAIKRDLDYLDKYENDLRYMAEGDHYQAYKDRLYNGGFDRMGYSQKDADEIKHYLDSGEIFMTDEFVNNVSDKIGRPLKKGSAYFYGEHFPYPGRIYLARDEYEDPMTYGIYGVNPRRHNKEYYQAALPTTVAHEVGHYVDNYRYYKPVTEGNGKLVDHEDFNPSFSTYYLKYGRMRLPTNTTSYFVGGNGDEIKRRVEQIRNMFNIKDPNQPLTREQFDFAKRYYTTLLMDNNMTLFFNSIKDPNKFLGIVNSNRRII